MNHMHGMTKKYNLDLKYIDSIEIEIEIDCGTFEIYNKRAYYKRYLYLLKN